MTQIINTMIHIIEPFKMKLVDVNSSIYVDFNEENGKEGPKLKLGDHVRLSK